MAKFRRSFFTIRFLRFYLFNGTGIGQNSIRPHSISSCPTHLMNGLDVGHVEDVDEDAAVGRRLNDLVLGFFGGSGIPANQVNLAAAFRDFKRSLLGPKIYF